MSSTNDRVNLPFDEVFVEVEGAWQKLSVAGFFALPVSTRIQHVIERTVTFRCKGQPLDQRAALAAIRRYRASKVEI